MTVCTDLHRLRRKLPAERKESLGYPRRQNASLKSWNLVSVCFHGYLLFSGKPTTNVSFCGAETHSGCSLCCEQERGGREINTPCLSFCCRSARSSVCFFYSASPAEFGTCSAPFGDSVKCKIDDFNVELYFQTRYYSVGQKPVTNNYQKLVLKKNH